MSRSLPSAFVIVFDNYQEMAADAPLHEVLALAATLPPPGVTLMVAGRLDPPAGFAQLRANGVLAVMGWEALRLTAEEFAAVAQRRGYNALDDTLLQRLHNLTETERLYRALRDQI